MLTTSSLPDREIFRVRDELMSHIGPETTFYDFLGVAPQATLDEINKAYRKKTRSLHPDKVKQQLTAERVKKDKANAKKTPGSRKKAGVTVTKPPSRSELRAAVKKASEMQARLSIVANILRGADRDRYDHFLANGFPTWKGTGYYYNRYRPGFGTVLAGLFVCVGGGAHYLALYMSWRRQREFVERYIKFARHAAWGENLGINLPGVDGVPAQLPPQQRPQPPPDEEDRALPANRKQRRLQEREAKREAAKEGSKRGRAGRAAAAAAAGSGSATPTPQQPQTGGPTGSRKRVVAENGKVLVVDSLGDVYLEQEDEDGNVAEFLLDVSPPGPRAGREKQCKLTPRRNSPTNSPAPPSGTRPSTGCPSGRTRPWSAACGATRSATTTTSSAPTRTTTSSSRRTRSRPTTSRRSRARRRPAPTPTRSSSCSRSRPTRWGRPRRRATSRPGARARSGRERKSRPRAEAPGVDDGCIAGVCHLQVERAGVSEACCSSGSCPAQKREDRVCIVCLE